MTTGAASNLKYTSLCQRIFQSLKTHWYTYLIIEFCHKGKLVGLDKLDYIFRVMFSIIVITSLIKLQSEQQEY